LQLVFFAARQRHHHRQSRLSHNTAYGGFALSSNTEGTANTAIGGSALSSNTVGGSNTAVGESALFRNTTGSFNTAYGDLALENNDTGSNNTALGNSAGVFLTTGDNNIDIGNVGNAAEANTIRIGEQGLQTATFIAGISGATVTGTAVIVDGSGQLGVAPSSARFKEAIKSMDNASKALFALKPVTFRYKKDIDPQGISQFGLVAEG
jgi:trimeric autotransporter adhesin